MDQKNLKIHRQELKLFKKFTIIWWIQDSPINYPKNQYRKFIKDVVSGTLERSDLIEETIKTNLNNDINLKKTDKLLKIILFAAVFELLFKHNNPKNSSN